MSNAVIQILRWGGILVAVVFVIALLVSGTGVGGGAEGEEASAAPTTLYWVLLIIGVVAAIVGFVTKPKSS